MFKSRSDPKSPSLIFWVFLVQSVTVPVWHSSDIKQGQKLKLFINNLKYLLYFQIKTHSSDAILFYNTGPASNKDFVALEIWEGTPRLLVDQVSQFSISISVYSSGYAQLYLTKEYKKQETTGVSKPR